MRVKTPTVLQMEVVECGAAALSIVLAYYGRFVSLEELRVACGVSRDGTKASNILKAARTYGLIAKGFSKQPNQLAELRMPAVAFWNFNHFVVVEGFAPGKVYLNDPARGPCVVSEDEFRSAFTGVVLVFEPGEQFVKGGQRPGMIGALRSRLRGSGAGLLYVVLASLALSITGLVIPIFTKVFVDNVLARAATGWIGPLLVGLLIIALLRAALTWLQRFYLLRLSTKLAVISSYQFLRHVLRLPVEFYTQRYGGEVGGRVEINDRLARVLSGDLTTSALNLLMIVLYVAVMLSLDVVLTSLGIVIAAVNFAALQYVSRMRKDINVGMLQERGKMLGTSMSGLQTIETMKATGRESDFFSRWAGHLAKVVEAEQKMQLSSLGLEAVPSFLSAITTVAILGVGATRVLEGQLSVGGLVAFQGLMLGFMDPIHQLVSLGSTVQELEGEMSRLDDVLRYPVDPAVTDDEPELPPGVPSKLSGSLELKEIVYGYSRLDPPLIQGFSMSLPPRARVALVGASASGKSTLAKIISGIYQPWQGEVLFDGQSRKQIPRQVVVNSVAMVDQEFFLYEGTVRQVLTMWDTTVPEADIIQAAKDACIHADITARAGGYDSPVEEGGRNFSGGQRQRLEIARALVGNPSLIILDEATSALDPITEQQIDENLRRRGCTCVMVAHRLSTIRDCDEIIVLDRGAIVQRGTHDELQARPGLYRQLISA